MSRLIQLLLALVLAGAAMTASAQSSYYDPDESGHGVTVQAVGDRYVAQWYFHDGSAARWVVTDVCDFSMSCALYTVDADGFPARGARLVDAGSISIERVGADALVIYAIQIPEIGCWTLPGPLPPACRDAWGVPDPSLIYRRGLSESGSLLLEALVE